MTSEQGAPLHADDVLPPSEREHDQAREELMDQLTEEPVRIRGLATTD